MSNLGLEKKVDKQLAERAKAILDAYGCNSGLDWFMRIFEEDPVEVAKKLYKSGIDVYDITALCFELRGDDDVWTQSLCDELETIYCEEECK